MNNALQRSNCFQLFGALGALTIVFFSCLFVVDTQAKNISKAEIKQKLANVLGGARYGVNAEEINILDSEVPNFYLVQHKGEYGLISKNGKHFLAGDAWNIDEGKNITQSLRQEFNLAQIKELDSNLFITFKAKNPKSSIWVFTDIDCFYCRKLHSEMPELNKLGITVNYLSFPRSGNENSQDWKKAVDVWCSKDQQRAMTTSKLGKDISKMPKRANCNPEIAKQFNLGRRLGVRATPTIVFANGKITSGYIPAKELLSHAIANNS